MKPRQEIDAKRTRLVMALRAQCRANEPGTALPGVRELAEKFGLSRSLVGEVIQGLAAEGILLARHGAGIFVQRPYQSKVGIFLLVGPENLQENTKQLLPMKLGFEERVTQLGGTSLTLPYQQAHAFLEENTSLEVEGIFTFVDESTWPAGFADFSPAIPQVTSGHLLESCRGTGTYQHCDWISFDHEDGGYQATRHLLEMGHERIAFLGLRSPEEPSGVLTWSRERQDGWERALSTANYDTAQLAFNPGAGRLLTLEDQARAAQTLAGQMIPLLRRNEFSAVVAVNCHAARGFFQALGAENISYETWPAVICFGAAESTGSALSVMTEMRMPWEELGKEAANLLWSRRNFSGQPRRVLVPLRLVSRLSCRTQWPLLPAAMASAMRHI